MPHNQTQIGLKMRGFIDQVRNFSDFGGVTRTEISSEMDCPIPTYINEFWTSKQRAASSLHEISYRACFKPQLPRFFIERLTTVGESVYDPFMGRGTTVIESALMGRNPIGCDINPLSKMLVSPRLSPPNVEEVDQRLREINLENETEIKDDLLVFYHPVTLSQISNLRDYFINKESDNNLDDIDGWIRMVATNRLTGHSPGFFSVYTLPPNQSVSIESQMKINEKRNQVPPVRDVKKLISLKTKYLLEKLTEDELKTIQSVAEHSLLLTESAESTSAIESESISLVVTSPPFLDVVDYRKDNWLRCWFNNIDVENIPIWQIKEIGYWQAAMTSVFKELYRILMPGGVVAFEVGDVKKKTIMMENLALCAAKDTGLIPIMVMINEQEFSKTSACWGVTSNKKGTNSNRIVVFVRAPD